MGKILLPTEDWYRLSWNLPSHIDKGLLRTKLGAGAMSYEAPIMGAYVEGPGSGDFMDLSSEGPEGWNFVYQEEENQTP